ncbi:GFA family protein [Rhizorhabdus dicambivorans]|uniref:Glutathione-dependent formaldehyde-activating protein n=1 Tax=Rhizorhabdus dicambivorans TaxID=1850238 RepID=A0A2A4FU69_9SPHN|nr:GFA family protein [Rhizorhabdus dicambivorans]ATE64293.1 glutathione-dependent formaldehyde-activating protein [Rhizorhabdus dicambivorans]PCE40941.1 glutathione-dependent formaldehyde-activating protein [Rhizorhabdus dicambivorans]
MDDDGLNGRCLCGAIRYRVLSEPFDAGYCHCRMCQRFSGAPVMAYASIPRDDLLFETGEPVRRRSSDIGERWFCGDCGSSLAMVVDDAPDLVDLALATLDDPIALPPNFHIWRESRIGWFDTIDALPRHEQARPRTERLRVSLG